MRTINVDTKKNALKMMMFKTVIEIVMVRMVATMRMIISGRS